MKKINILFLIASVAGFLVSCEIDNAEEPKSLLQGQIHYEGDPIHVGAGEVGFQLWEPGWELDYPIDVAVSQDGSYSALLFDGEYKVIIGENQGPFRNITTSATLGDTILVNVNGNTELDIEVEPYYMIRGVDHSVEARDDVATEWVDGERVEREITVHDVTVNFSLEQIIGGEESRDVEWVYLTSHKRQFVDNIYNLERTSLRGSAIEDMDNMSMVVTVPEMVPSQDYAFIRIGVKIQDVEALLFSEVIKVEW
jgi:hypothetical protein